MNVKVNNLKMEFTATDFTGLFLFTWERWEGGHYIPCLLQTLRHFSESNRIVENGGKRL